MTFEAVKEAGQFGFFDSIVLFFSSFIYILGFFTIIVLIVIISLCLSSLFSGIFIRERKFRSNLEFQGVNDKEKLDDLTKKYVDKKSDLIFVILLLICTPTVFSLSPTLFNSANYTLDFNKDWVNEDVSNYINHLPEHKADIQAASRISSTEKSFKLDSDYFGSVDANLLVQSSIAYADENDFGRELKTNALVKFDLKENEKPYMTYKQLEHDLGHDITPGMYNVTLHLPLGFYFNQ